MTLKNCGGFVVEDASASNWREPSLRAPSDWTYVLNYTQAYHNSDRKPGFICIPNWCYFIVVLQYITNISEFITTVTWLHTPTNLFFPTDNPLVDGRYKGDSIWYQSDT